MISFCLYLSPIFYRERQRSHCGGRVSRHKARGVAEGSCYAEGNLIPALCLILSF
ncbi:hypothetical protein [Fischerella thermalis]|uniref:hypothetical protein n=1 Tax=Fischerella thermalis TaxID=372787 RepID=UPI0015E0A5A5|nr:hypothetical protein [Fischerella thermalis]MBF1989904.1 hypothetical protein [Fischerella thermalis M58_A2018_009]